MKSYTDILQKILEEGIWKDNRTGIKTKSITGYMFEHDMSSGFPLLTTKFMGTKPIRVELEGFIKGISSKKWFQERGCHIWDEWANPQKVPYGNDAESKAKMKAEDDLGCIYGNNWRSFASMFPSTGLFISNRSGVAAVDNAGVDQLKYVIDGLKKDPTSRRLICSAWNPLTMKYAALPACHYSWQVLSDGESVDLLWNQRSVDTPLGLSYNIASYALLLTLIGKECNLVPRKLIGFLADVHIYQNQMDGVMEQLKREPYPLPTIEIPNFTSIFDWTHDDFVLKNYKSHEKINFPIAV